LGELHDTGPELIESPYGIESTQIRPPARSTIFLQMASPMPVHSGGLVAPRLPDGKGERGLRRLRMRANGEAGEPDDATHAPRFVP